MAREGELGGEEEVASKRWKLTTKSTTNLEQKLKIVQSYRYKRGWKDILASKVHISLGNTLKA